MRSFFFAPTLSVFFFLCGIFLLSTPAHADGFTGYRVGYSSGSVSNIGLTDAGTLTTYVSGLGVYRTFTPPGTTSISAAPPPFTFDNGSSCSVSFAGLSTAPNARCNGQYSLFSAYTATSGLPSLYLLAGGTLQTIYAGATTNILLNALGDFAFVGLNGSDADTNFLFYNNTTHAAAAVTPEPSSLVLLLSGGCCCGMLLRQQGRR